MVTMYIGMNDKDLHKQVKSARYFKQEIAKEMDCTIFECTGIYKGEIEKSLKIEVFGKTAKECREIARRLCVKFNQESIIVNGKFITAA